MRASELIDTLQFEINENYAVKVVDWLNGRLDIPWHKLKPELENLFTTKQFRLEIRATECDDANLEMWAENGNCIYICPHIHASLNDEGYNDEEMKAKLLHELSHIIRQRTGKSLGAPEANIFLSGREYPARAFEVAWVVSLHYTSLDKYIADVDNERQPALGLLWKDMTLQTFSYLRREKHAKKFIKLANRYTKILAYYRGKYGLK
jgi:hypothetical protein